MDPSREELMELSEQVAALQAALERVRDEMAVATAAEEALVEKLRALGVPIEAADAKTTVDVPGVPRRRPRRTTAAMISPLKAAAVGASLAIGLALVVLLMVNLTVARRVEVPAAASAAPAPASASAATISRAETHDDARDVPPPPPAVEAASPRVAPSVAAPSLASALVPKSADAHGNGYLTVVCTPACDSITDNGVALSPSAANVPVPAGSHKLVLTAPNGAKKTMHVNVAPGQTQKVNALMELGLPVNDRGF